MCLFRQPKATPMSVPANPVQPRLANESARKGSALPEDKDLLDADEVADVSFGSSKKKADNKAGTRTGAGALTIGLNQSGNTNSGYNV
jgi:hypothetical protein